MYLKKQTKGSSLCIVLILPIFTEVTSKIYAAGNKGTNQKQIAGALVFLQLLGLVNRCLPGHWSPESL